jgi:hypothetical protein
MRRWGSEQGQTSGEYLGALALVAVIIAAVALSGIGNQIAAEIELIICRIAGGTCEAEQRAAEPERCLESTTTTQSGVSALIAVVRIDKDSILIRENFSDGTARFTILDNSEIAGEVYAGLKGKIDKYGVNYAVSADAGVALAGARVFEVNSQPEADAFQERVQAAGGFDGILRDVAGYNDEIPIIGVDNPFGGIDDWALDQIGIDDNEDLPTPSETYIEAGAFLEGNGDLGAGGLAQSAELQAMLRAAGVVKVKTSGPDKGDAEVSFELSGEAGATLTQAALGGGVDGEVEFTVTIKLDAQNGFRPDELEIKGTAGYTGTFDFGHNFQADELADISKLLETLKLTGSAGDGHGLEVGGRLDLKDPENLAATLALLRGVASPGQLGPAAIGIAQRLNEDGILSFETFDTSSSETEGEIKVGIGPGLGAGGDTSTNTQSGRRAWERFPGGTFQPKRCKLA